MFTIMGRLSTILVVTLLGGYSASIYGAECEYMMGLSCPPSEDPQSFIDGYNVQVNGGVGAPGCPPVFGILWEWGDSTNSTAWFPASHSYAGPGNYTLAVTAYNDAYHVLAHESCLIQIEPMNLISCSGFYEPMADYPVWVKRNRVLPLKIELFDKEGYELTDTDLLSPPMVSVMFTPLAGGIASDVSDEAYPSGKGTDGNQFEYTDDGTWQFNLKSTNYTAPGLYLVSVESFDPEEYVIEQSCVTSFEIR